MVSRDLGGLEEAREHGYKPLALGARKCLNCAYASGERVGKVHCSMFGFLAQARGVCDEWEREKA